MAKADPAEVFAALAQGADLAAVGARFQLSRDELLALFQDAADRYRRRAQAAWRLFCDGAARGNPGPAGAGAILYDPKGVVRARLTRFLGLATNNVAEYQALLLGLTEARRLGVGRLAIFADSELLVKQLTGRYQVKAPHLLPLWRAARELVQQFQAASVSHLPRAENREADLLANQAIDQEFGGG